MNALVDAIALRCAALLAGQSFDDPSDNTSPVAMQIYKHAIPVATTEAEKQEQAPYVVVRVVGIEDQDGKTVFVVRLGVELFTWSDVEAGYADLDRLLAALRPICQRGPSAMAGYKVLHPTVWQIGNKESGNQPHPFYECFCELRIVGAK